MFDFVYRKKRVVQVILALITLPFAFFGVDYYFRSAGSVTEIAKVGGDRITQAEYADTVREQQDRMRQAQGANFDPAVFVDAEAFLKDVKIDDAAVKAFYDANPAMFQTPEEVRLEYVSLTPDSLSGQV